MKTRNLGYSVYAIAIASGGDDNDGDDDKIGE